MSSRRSNMDPAERAYRIHKSILKKKRRKEAEALKALLSKRATFELEHTSGAGTYDAKSGCINSDSTAGSVSKPHPNPQSSQTDRLVYVFDNYSEKLAFERIKTAIIKDAEVNCELLYALASVFDESAFPPEILVPCARCQQDFDPNYDTMASCKLPHHEIERLLKAQCSVKWTCYECRKKSVGCDSNFCDDVVVKPKKVLTTNTDGGNDAMATDSSDIHSPLHSQRDRLLYIFSKISIKILFGRIKRAVKEGADDKLVGSLATLFGEDIFPSKVSLTCARCKEEFDPNYNSMMSCKLPHYEIDRSMKHGYGATWTCHDCKRTWEGDDYNFCDADVGYCFEGPHTAIVDDSSDPDSEFETNRLKYW